jgi:hypothetical protein
MAWWKKNQVAQQPQQWTSTEMELAGLAPVPVHADADAVINLDRQGGWYEHRFVDHRPAGDWRSVMDTIAIDLRPLVDYAATYRTFIMATVHATESNDNRYTVMPAYNDPAIAAKLAPRYKAAMRGAWAHVIIDGETFEHFGYNDSNQLGIKDEFVEDGTVAFDVSRDQGIRADTATMVRGKMVFKELGWYTLAGQADHLGDFDYRGGGETEVVPLRRIEF